MITQLRNQIARSFAAMAWGILSTVVAFHFLGGRAAADLTTSEPALGVNHANGTVVGVGAGMQTRGYTFTLDFPREVTHLGMFNYDLSGSCATDRHAGVWDSEGNLVAEVVILANAANSEIESGEMRDFIYAELPEHVVLSAGELYTIGIWYSVDNCPGLVMSGTIENGQRSDIAAGFHYVEMVETGVADPDAMTFKKPTVTRPDRIGGYIGPNLRFSTAPLPPRWVAFNDCVDTDPANTPANATSYGLGRSYSGDGNTGNLLDFQNGADTGATVTFTENTSAGNTINWATDAANFTVGTDAEAIFGGKLNLSGNLSYNDTPGWSLDLKFTNLNPTASYTFTGTVNRNGGDGYRSRVTNWTIMGAGASTFASSEGTHKVTEASVEFSTGHNPEGYVAKWTNIRPAADGSFTIRTSHGVGEANGGIPGADAYRGYAGGMFMLAEQGSLSTPQNLFTITSIEYDAVAASATITWPSRSGRSYAVDFSDDLGLGHWIEINDNILADSDTLSFTEENIVAPSGRRFYRVRQNP
jgi:hypothetical protein